MNKNELVAFLKASKETATDDVALKAKELYPPFDKIKGTWQKKGARCTQEIDGKVFLFKLTCEDQTAEGTYIVENWTPKDTPAIWTGIDETHSGTIDDPIPAVVGMEYEYGKYYSEGETVYLMNREVPNGKIKLDHLPSQLVGHYFEIVQV